MTRIMITIMMILMMAQLSGDKQQKKTGRESESVRRPRYTVAAAAAAVTNSTPHVF